MNQLQHRWRFLGGLLLLLVLAAGGLYWLWRRPAPLPGPNSPRYQQYLRAFQIAVAALDTDQKELARSKLDEAIALIPQEPAGWVNRGLLYLRRNQLAQAAQDLEQARRLAPGSGSIEALLGYLARAQGRLPEAVAHFRRAAEQQPRDLPLLYTLAQTVSEEGGPDSQAEYQRLLKQILDLDPYNLKALLEWARAACRQRDPAAFQEALQRLARLAPSWKPEVQKKFAEVQHLPAAEQTIPLLVILDNLLKGERGYSRSALALAPNPALVGTPVYHFLRLPAPRPTPAPPEEQLTFTLEKEEKAAEAVPAGQAVRLAWQIQEKERQALFEASRGGTSGGSQVRPAELYQPVLLVANAVQVHRLGSPAQQLPFPGSRLGKQVPVSAAGVLPVDLNNDLRPDLVLAGAGGLRFYQQQADGRFQEVTAKSGLPASLLTDDYYGVWAADLDSDGDLDLLAARRQGPLVVLRNNQDGTFQELKNVFPQVAAVRAFVWADLDNDGMPDAVFLDAAGQLHLFSNERQGQFAPWPAPADLGKILAVTAADVNDDGLLDLVVLNAAGVVQRLTAGDRPGDWQKAELARLPAPLAAAPGEVRLLLEDLDNNGAADLIISEPQKTYIFLADEQFRFRTPPQVLELSVYEALDRRQQGRLDLLGLSSQGQLFWARNQGQKSYRWQIIRPLANPAGTGDNRNNSFALGGEVEIRAGMLVHKRPITGPVLHFGLGEQPGVDVIRLVWPNGVATWEFEQPADTLVRVVQRLSGSCPFLFTWNGQGWHFAGDFMWGTPLGMYLNGQYSDIPSQTTEWLKIPGAQLQPRAGYYEVRVQANLWETDFFDLLSLLVVDHPPGTEVYADERCGVALGPPRLYVTEPVRPVAHAWDHHGREVTEWVRALDGRYLDVAGRGRFQGITADHWVEVDLGEEAPQQGPVYLIAHGWLHPTDSSINVAVAQGRHDPPRDLTLEVPDGRGGWKVGREHLGFPAGRNKTILLRLDGVAGSGVCRRFRLRTNLEIYWDFLGYARPREEPLSLPLEEGEKRLGEPERPRLLVRRLKPHTAELRYRGILEIVQKDRSSPEIPVYDRVTRGQRWRDLSGYYTRYGLVRELLVRRDDRYVIMNAGDELVLRFVLPPAPPAGWQRDFLWESDGWTRDGNQNTRFGTSVLPLPAHGQPLEQPPGRLEDDPVYRRFPQDWIDYHTRYVTAAEFARGLRTFSPDLQKR
jgi:Tfp pilus assembly protein PilF